MKKIKLSKKNQARNRFVRNLLSSLILFEQVETTPARAKALKAKASSFFAKIGKLEDTVSCKRYIGSVLYGGAQQKAYDFRKNFKAINLYKVDNRFGDNAQMTLVKIQLEENTPQKPATKGKTK